jgi:hypothetical protein
MRRRIAVMSIQGSRKRRRPSANGYDVPPYEEGVDCRSNGVVARMCTDDKLPLAPTAIAGTDAAAATAVVATTFRRPRGRHADRDRCDSANNGFGIDPLAITRRSCAGRSAGWDIEYRPGGIVRAAAAGTVDERLPIQSRQAASRSDRALVAAHYYRTVYTNLASVNADIAPRKRCRVGQPLAPQAPQAPQARR